jgi:hypothetical protein
MKKLLFVIILMTPHFAFGQQKILVSKTKNEVMNPDSAMTKDSLLWNCRCERSIVPFKDYDRKMYYVYVEKTNRMFIIRKRGKMFHKDYLKKLGE